MFEFKYTCIVDTPYALALYFLRMGTESVSRTRFFVGQTLPDEIFKQLPNAVRIEVDKQRCEVRLYRLGFRLKCLLFHLRYVVGTKIFAQDHIFCAPPLVCGMRYTLIEDGPGFYGWNPHRPSIDGFFVRLGLWVLNGPIYLKHFGRNEQCVNRWVTSDEDARIYQEEMRQYEHFDVSALWKKAPKELKTLILRLFGDLSGGTEIESLARSCRTILLTQPLMEDFGLSSDELVAVYRPVVEKYKDTGICIKIHPRDKFDYGHAFPGCKVMKTRIPMQLLCAFGVKVERAITPFSTAISEFPDDTEIVWLGTEINEKIKKACGVLAPPRKFLRVVKC